MVLFYMYFNYSLLINAFLKARMLAYPSNLTRCRKSENPSKTTNLERVTTIPRQGAGWLSGRLSDSGARSRGFETYLRRVVSLSKTFYFQKYWYMSGLSHCFRTEKSLAGTLCLNTGIKKLFCLKLIIYLGSNMDRSSDKRVFYHSAIPAPV